MSWSATSALLVFGLAIVSAPALAWAPGAAPPRMRQSSHRLEKKSPTLNAEASAAPATLVWVHDGSCVPIVSHPLDQTPSAQRFERLVADRINQDTHALDPQLLELLRKVAHHYPYARIELVSGFRSPKFNEMLRKKGRNVAKSSQHSEGNAVDFRIIPGDASGDPLQPTGDPLDPFEVETWLRTTLDWQGGIGVYPGRTDRFVHADVGPKRRWISR